MEWYNVTRFRRGFRRSFHKKAHWQWVRGVTDIAPAHPTTNFDLLASYKTRFGITINLPDITIWRIKLRISIVITTTAQLAAKDGVLSAVFVDSPDRADVSQLSFPFDQQHLTYELDYLSHVPAEGGGSAAGTYYIERVFDIKSHRKLTRSVDASLWYQAVEASANCTISSLNVQYSILLKLP